MSHHTSSKKHKSGEESISVSKSSEPSLLNLVIGTVVVIGIVAFVLWVQLRTSASDTDASAQSPYAGRSDATVVVEEYSNYTCGHCVQAHKVMKTEILPEYGDRIKFVHRDFPFTTEGPDFKAAIAARCAQRQGKFWEFHDFLFERQSSWAHLKSDQLRQTFLSYAHQSGVSDPSAFEVCIDSEETSALVKADVDTARQKKIGGTPTFFINGERVESYTTLRDSLKKQFGE